MCPAIAQNSLEIPKTNTDPFASREKPKFDLRILLVRELACTLLVVCANSEKGLGVVPSQDEWDQRYLRIAKEVASWSKDAAKVGAVVVRRNRIVSTGYNGFPENVLDDDRLQDKATKQLMVVHAEENAILSAGDLAREATLYVVGKPVCARCAASIIQAGVKRVVAQRPLVSDSDNRPTDKHNEPGSIDWNKMGELARDMFAEAGVKLHYKQLPIVDAKLPIASNEDQDEDMKAQGSTR